MRIVLIDHRDSFTWNLAHLFGQQVGALPEVVESDALDVAALSAAPPDLLLLGPGPGHPAKAADAGRSPAAITALRGKAPLFGVCFGLQLLVVEAGGRVVRTTPRHGRSWPIEHADHFLFAGLESPVAMMRYHSLVAERATLPATLRVAATTAEGEVMAIERVDGDACAVQFHPESVGSPRGEQLAKNVLEWAIRWRRSHRGAARGEARDAVRDGQ